MQLLIIDAAEPVGSAKDGTLFAISERSWEAEYRNAEYDRAPIHVGAKVVSISMVFCSKTKPVVFDASGGGKWQATDVRPGDDRFAMGATEAVHQFYYAACHHFITHDPVSKAMASKLGYRFAGHPIGDEPEQDTRQPLDVLR